MRRRAFLALAGGLALLPAAELALPRKKVIAAIDRLSKWQPNGKSTLAAEWRYAAGRITDDVQDYGFVISLTAVKFPTPAQELLVERQDFTGAKAFIAKAYTGALTYNETSATYTFQADQSQVSASWQLDTAAQNYRLTVTSPELSLQDVVLQPQGDLIPEGGDGVIRVGQAQGFQIGSDYHADWTRMEVGGQPHGVARVDMQGLYPLLQSAAVARAMGSPGPTQASADYDHRWFAVAGQADGQAVWISAWRIEAPGGPFWDVTIARANGQDWQVASTTEQSAAVEALTIRELAWQALPPTAGEGALRAGAAWRITAGVLRPGDLLDLEIAVPPGQFATSARFGTLGGLTWMEEAVGVTAFGMVGRQALSDVTLAVAESTAEFYVGYLPLVRR